MAFTELTVGNLSMLQKFWVTKYARKGMYAISLLPCSSIQRICSRIAIQAVISQAASCINTFAWVRLFAICWSKYVIRRSMPVALGKMGWKGTCRRSAFSHGLRYWIWFSISHFHFLGCVWVGCDLPFPCWNERLDTGRDRRGMGIWCLLFTVADNSYQVFQQPNPREYSVKHKLK